MKVIHSLSFLILMAGSILFTGCKQDGSSENSEPHAEMNHDQPVSNQGQAYIDDDSETPNALRLAIESPDHNTLEAAVEAAGVQNSLVNVGPLTVFAPTDAAFEKLPEGTVENLLKPENKRDLSYILKHHVAPSNYPVETLVKNVEKGRTLYMASGENVEVTMDGDDIYVGGKKIIGTVKVSNGWVHVIDEVILPENL
ncbi:fasciclin domain-containing protein [Salinimicrobium terrae]|uniref:fasciclin domain-containing protein n=1 Tax=Salinimicrobium terrae TaxID=470866 RepID=UPI00048D04AA|nr:fasciclin domain-containing protein [Salinimicrobium terrae]